MGLHPNFNYIGYELMYLYDDMTLFQCYAPTNDANEEVKNVFYEQLQQEVDNTPDHDIKTIMVI